MNAFFVSWTVEGKSDCIQRGNRSFNHTKHGPLLIAIQLLKVCKEVWFAIIPSDPGITLMLQPAAVHTNVRWNCAAMKLLVCYLLTTNDAVVLLSHDKIHCKRKAQEFRVFFAGSHLPSLVVSGLQFVAAKQHLCNFPECYAIRAPDWTCKHFCCRWPGEN